MTHHVILYGKPDCHLCHIAHQLLLGMQREFDLTIEETDITADPKLMKLYGEAIPVLLIDNATLLSAPIRTAEVRAALIRKS